MHAVTAILEDDALPFGFEEAFTVEGAKYYIDHASQTTTWVHPASSVVRQGVVVPGGGASSRPKPPPMRSHPGSHVDLRTSRSGVGLQALDHRSRETYG
jgi:hypothetical protein